MNKEYKQWKSILASKKFLIPVTIVGLFLLYFLSVFVFNLGCYSLGYLKLLLDSLQQVTAVPTFSIPFSPSFFLIYRLSLTEELATLQLVLLVLFWTVAFYKIGLKLYKVRRAYENINLGTEGTQRFTELEDLEKQYRKVKMDDQEYEGLSGIPVCAHNGYIYIDDSNTNSETLGSTQSGKTEAFTYPTMDLGMRASIKDSFLIFDVKGNMIRKTKAEWEKYGYDVHCLNLIDPDNSMSYNPLELIREAYIAGDYGKAQMLAQTFSYSIYHDENAKDKFWQDTSIALLNALILAVCDIAIKTKHMEYVTIYSVVQMLITLSANPDESGKTNLDYYFESLPSDNPARLQFSMIEKATGITRSGIYTNTQSKLAPYLSTKLAKMTASSTIKLSDLAYGEKPIALFMVIPDYDASNYQIISTFITQVNYVLAEKATASASGKLPRRVRRLFEEVANVPAIEGLSRAMNVDLERGILTHLLIQSEAQLTHNYGEQLAKAITGACGNKIYIMSDNEDDAKLFSSLLGDKTIIAPNRNGDPLSIDKSYGENEKGRRLLDENEIRLLREGEWLFIRTKKRKDLEGNPIRPYPIYANRDTETQMPFAYQYLGDRFKSDKPLSEYELGDGHESLDLKTLIIPHEEKLVEEDVYVEEVETFDYDHSSNVWNNYDHTSHYNQSQTDQNKPAMGVKELEDKIESVSETSTLLTESLSDTKINLLNQLVLNNVDQEEYHYFLQLETIEEVKNFLATPERTIVRKQIEKLVFK